MKRFARTLTLAAAALALSGFAMAQDDPPVYAPPPINYDEIVMPTVPPPDPPQITIPTTIPVGPGEIGVDLPGGHPEITYTIHTK
jgi:hypothetical protein